MNPLLLEKDKVWLRRTGFITLSILIAFILDVPSPVFFVLLAPTLIMAPTFNLAPITKSITRQFKFLITGVIVGEIFYQHQLTLIILSSFFFYLITLKATHEHNLPQYASPIFYYFMAIVNTTYDIPGENSVRGLVTATVIMLPIAWLFYQWIPSHVSSTLPQESTVKPIKITTSKASVFTLVLTLVLGFYLYFEVNTAIFCAVVVIGAMASLSLEQMHQSLRTILPIQITGCLLGLAVNVLASGPDLWLLSWGALLFVLIGWLIHEMMSEEARDHEIPNFEISLLMATLIPISLYSHADSINADQFAHRALDMAVTFVLLWFVILAITQFVNWKNKRVKSPS
ncbi:hypothetical protein BCU70_20790 [Vibrio sp. 10N.286.49.C2]|uniref:DUF2955 domain-containing protein n=1 Tax=unclassified Vibrio TaxID=2614977 RepID=UPI000C85F3DA|nr:MULTISPECIES: DUF2955 domain-containing protein [unclassified Vibrio]PMH33178.1 hypothetical protein BCU70_20790 [Vibrio sp. 10N.286.49.C2]PMH51208.1 hypothetical protein BCU66_17430 [Vibrio sp. 10N.286.49.B1]PMH81970.1 hypothetical protein BCU58_19720 [Vibrio sp. 10N.286.48.B7]